MQIRKFELEDGSTFTYLGRVRHNGPEAHVWYTSCRHIGYLCLSGSFVVSKTESPWKEPGFLFDAFCEKHRVEITGHPHSIETVVLQVVQDLATGGQPLVSDILNEFTHRLNIPGGLSVSIQRGWSQAGESALRALADRGVLVLENGRMSPARVG